MRTVRYYLKDLLLKIFRNIKDFCFSRLIHLLIWIRLSSKVGSLQKMGVIGEEDGKERTPYAKFTIIQK